MSVISRNLLCVKRSCSSLAAYDAIILSNYITLHYITTCKASRFDSNSNRPSDSIRFESDWQIRKFSNRIGRACSFARRKLSQTTQTINGTQWYSIQTREWSYAGSLMCLRIVMRNM